MSSATLEGCWAKLNRAEEQLNLLGDELTDYIESHPYEISSEPDKRGKWKVFTYQNVRHPPARFGVIAGEAIHDMRSCLDHLVWQLVRLAGNGPTDRNEFPICVLKEARKQKEKRHAWNRDWPDRLKGIDTRHIAVIESAQPYKRRRGPKGHELCILTSLWNSDKHRIVHAAALSTPMSAPANITIDMGGFDRVVVEMGIRPGRLKNGADAVGVQVLSAPYGVPRHMDVKGQFPIEVTFGGRRVGIRRLRDIGDFICKFIFDNFRLDFPRALNEPDRALFHTPPDQVFKELPPGETQLTTRATADTSRRFDGWKVWFLAGFFVPTPTGGLVLGEPTWNIKRDDDEQGFGCVATGLEPERFRFWLLEQMQPTTVQQVCHPLARCSYAPVL